MIEASLGILGPVSLSILTISSGSEHTIGSTAFPLEMHLVHYKAVHNGLAEALQEGAFDSLAVLGVFFSVQLGDLVHVPSLDTLITAMENITEANTETEVIFKIMINTAEPHFPQMTPFPISDFIPGDMSRFFRYNGSLTTPSCDEIVQVPPRLLYSVSKLTTS